MTIRKPTKGAVRKDLWSELPKPFFVTAPMANVTDSVFRKLFVKYGKPDVIWTEFVSADGLISAGKKKLLTDLEFTPKERPIVAQLFTGHPEAMKKAATIVAKLGFDGLDINMGCPDRAVERQGGGSALIKNQEAAIEVLRAAREGVRSIGKGVRSIGKGVRRREIPISIKTRLGYKTIDLDWIKLLLEQKLPALIVHLRTRKEMSDFSAHWEVMPEIIKLRDQISPKTLIIGNGDVQSLDDARSKAKKYGCDGVMIGRGIFGKPWFFNKHVKEKTPKERLEIMVEHAKLFEKDFGSNKSGEKHLKNFEVMRKHFKAYVSGWDGAKELRVKLMEAENTGEVEQIVREYLKTSK